MDSKAGWALNLFGRPQLIDAWGREANLPRKAFVLVSRLIDEAPDMRLDRDEAAAFLWPCSHRSQRLANLRALGKRVRAVQLAAGSSLLVFDSDHVAFDAAGGVCDVLELRRALKTGNMAELAARRPALDRLLLEGCENETPDLPFWLSDRRWKLIAAAAALSSAAAESPDRGQATTTPAAPGMSAKRPSVSPLLVAPLAPDCNSPELALAFPTLVDDLAALFWKARAVRVALRDGGASDEPAYRLDLYLRNPESPQLGCRIVHAPSGEVVWSERAALDPSAHEDVLHRLAQAGLVCIERREIAVSAGVAENELSPFVLVAKAERDLECGDLPAVRRARRRFRTALQSGPGTARAYAGMARSYWLEWVLRAGPDPTLLEIAEDLARKAIAADPECPDGFRELGMIASYRRRPETALKFLERAMNMAPENLALRFDWADAAISSGAHAEALASVEGVRSEADFAAWVVATGKYLRGDYESALRLIEQMQNPLPAWRARLMALGMAGKRGEAEVAARQAREFHPVFNLDTWLRTFPISNRRDREHIEEGFHRAGFTGSGV